MDRRPLDPRRALLHPLWLTCLALLLLNDHVLKHAAGIAGAPVTGKLSDVAGLVIAPILLAVLIRARRHGALLAIHGVTGAVFAAINVSPAAAGAFESLTALGPLPWAITVDPTDLLALPALGLSWALLRHASSGATSPRRSGVAVAAIAGALACAATSPAPTTPDPFFPTHWANLAVSNMTAPDCNIIYY